MIRVDAVGGQRDFPVAAVRAAAYVDAMDPPTYVALGDSTSVGYGASAGGGYPARLHAALAAAGVPLALQVVGENGATTADVVRRQLPRLPTLAPALVTLGIGTNDLWRMVPVARMATDLDAIGSALARTGAPVVVSNVIDLSLAPIGHLVEHVMRVPLSAFHARLTQINEALAAFANTHGFELVDLCAHSRDVLPQHPEYFSSDGFHPSAAGYDAWASWLLPAALHRTRR